MDDRALRSPSLASLVVLSLAATLATKPAMAGEPAPSPAREGLAVAASAARAWASDAVLVYVENDDVLDASGRSPRWGYLFHSPSRERARVWSVRDGRIALAEDLDLRFDAPPVPAGWLDSDAALAAAEKGGGGAFRKEHGGRLETMLLMRGAVSERGADVTTWTFVYRAPGAPSLFVVVNAADGKVQRTWRA